MSTFAEDVLALATKVNELRQQIKGGNQGAWEAYDHARLEFAAMVNGGRGAVPGRERRKYGTGTVQRHAKGWRWTIMIGGIQHRGETVPTYEEGEAALGVFLASIDKACGEPAPEPKDRPPPPGTGAKPPGHEVAAKASEAPASVDASTSIVESARAMTAAEVATEIPTVVVARTPAPPSTRVAWSPNWPPRLTSVPDEASGTDAPVSPRKGKHGGGYRCKTCGEEGHQARGCDRRIGSSRVARAAESASRVSAVIASIVAAPPEPETPSEPEVVTYVQLRSDAEVAALVEQYIPLAHKVARRFARYASTLEAIDYDDLFIAAQTGIMKAARTWDPSKGATFMTHGFNHARWGVHLLLRAMELVEPDKAKRWEAAGVILPSLVSMSAPLKRSDPDSRTVGETLATTIAVGDSGDDLESSDLIDRVEKATAVLGRRDREIVFKFYREERTLEDVGREFGLTRERIRQIVMRSVEKIRAAMSADAVGDWSAMEPGGRRRCLVCNGAGEERPGLDCPNCDGEGYRWEQEERRTA